MFSNRLLLALALWLGLTTGAFAGIGTCTDLGHNQASTGVSALTITTTAAIVAGDLVCVDHYAASTTGTISGTGSDGTNTAYAVVATSGAGATVYELACTYNALAVSSGASLTFNFSGGTGIRHGISAFQVSGIMASNAIDGKGTVQSSAATTLAPAIAALKAPNELVVLTYNSATTPTTWTLPGGWTQVGGNTATAFALPACGTVSSTAAATYTSSWTGSNNVRASVATFEGVTQPVTSGSRNLLGIGQ